MVRWMACSCACVKARWLATIGLAAAPTACARSQRCCPQFLVTRNDLADCGVAESNFLGNLCARSTSLVGADDLLAPFVLAGRAELSGVVFFHAPWDSPQFIKFTVFVGRIYRHCYRVGPGNVKTTRTHDNKDCVNLAIEIASTIVAD